MLSGLRTEPGLAPGKTPLEVELTLERIVPERYKHSAHHWLILHGRYVCKARRPECWRCLHQRHLPLQTEDTSAGLMPPRSVLNSAHLK
jgi:endonuclease III